MLGLRQQIGGGEVGPRAVSSAMIITSLGPGSESTPTVPNTWRFASQT